MQHHVAVLLRGVIATFSGCSSLSDKKSLYDLDMSKGSNNCPRRVFLLSRDILGFVIDLIYGEQCKCKR